MRTKCLLIMLAVALVAAACAGDAQEAVADAAPLDESTVEPPPTTAEPTTTTTSTTTTTTEAPPETECSGAGYEIQLPDGWSHQECTTLTSGDSTSEVTLAITSDESYREALRNLTSSETITGATLTTISEAEAVRLEIDSTSTTYVVNTGEGNFIASGPEPFVTDVVNDATITSAPPAILACSAESTRLETDTVLNSGQADVDGDGDLETISLVASDRLTNVEIEGLAAVEGTVVGPVQFGRTDPQSVLGWTDWDGDGLPEIITREPAGPAFGDVHHVHSIDGCGVERIATLVNDARAGSTDVYVCERNDDGVLDTLTTMLIRQTSDISPAEITNRSITSVFTGGILVSLETEIAVTSDVADLTPPIEGPVNLASCGTLF